MTRLPAFPATVHSAQAETGSDVRRLVAGFVRTVVLQAVLIMVAHHSVWAAEPPSPWHYGAYVDLSYPVNFNFPENHQWRSRATTYRTNELTPNLALAYIRKKPTVESRWGFEFGVQGGYDTDRLVPSPIPGRDEPVGGAGTLRHFSPTNVSYLAPVGNGLTVTAGLFTSYIGYESFYARANPNYTRAYIADNSPYFLFGLNARYPLSDRVNLSLYVVNGYSYLSHPNDQPGYGAQITWKPAPKIRLIENAYFGPDQPDTDIRFWRAFSDTILEWKDDHVLLAVAYDIGSEEAAEQPHHPRTFWMGGAFFARWYVSGPWSVAARPEFYWDRNGRLTGAKQLLFAMTTTVEYRWVYRAATTLARLEYRFDRSTGPEGGFFTNGQVAPGVIELTPNQNLLIFSLNWFFDL